MKGSDIFKSKSLKAEDLKGKGPVTVIIDKVTVQEFDDNSSKPVIHFRSKSGKPLDKSLVANRTNWYAIAEQLGDDSDAWTGKPITLIATKTDYQGKRVDCIRVDDPPAQSKKPLEKAPFEPEEDNTPFNDEPDDEVGF